MSVATVLTVCRGRVKGVPHEGGILRTAIFKSPVEGPVRVTRLGLEGDAQADTRHHGGPEMALLAYSATHYPHWKAFLGRDLERGQFGENLTVSRLEKVKRIDLAIEATRSALAVVGLAPARTHASVGAGG